MRARAAVVVLLLGLVFTASVWAKTSIQVYHRDNARETKWLKRMQSDFEAANPEIAVELVAGPSGFPYIERLTVLWASGNPPDVYYGSGDKAGYILNGWALDLTNYIKRDQAEIELRDFLPGAFVNATRQNRNYGVPATTMGTVIFYNRSLLEEAGLPSPPPDWDSRDWTWNEFTRYAERLTRFGDDSRAIQVGFNAVKMPDVVWTFGGDWFPPDAYETGIPSSSTLMNEANVRAYEAAQELYFTKGVAAAGPRSAVNAGNGFVQGKSAMQWQVWWVIRDYLANRENGTMSFDWGMAPVPLVQNRQNARVSDPWFISSATKSPEAAWQFVKYVTGREGQLSFTSYVAFPPSRRSALEAYLQTVRMASGMRTADAMTAISGALNHSRPALDEIIGGKTTWQPLIKAELNPVLQGERGARAALQSAQQVVDAVLRGLVERWGK